MRVKKFLYLKLAALAEAFPHITIKYEYDSMIDCHVVQLSLKKGEYLEDLHDAWFAIKEQLWKKYPGEDIVFTRPNKILTVDNPEFVFNDKKSVEEPVLQ